MTQNTKPPSSSILLLVAGAKGAVGSTLAAAVAEGHEDPDAVTRFMTSRNRFPTGFPPLTFEMAGWDTCSDPYTEVWEKNGVLPEPVRRRCRKPAGSIPVRKAPDPAKRTKHQILKIQKDIRIFLDLFPGAHPVFIDLLPASHPREMPGGPGSSAVPPEDLQIFPDSAYALAAVDAGIPVVNFTPNAFESPRLLSMARRNGVPMAGRDGKTGQTFLKVVLASALKARAFSVNGWYSLNLLGNADGKNLMIPENASGKLANKTAVLDAVLGLPREGEDRKAFHKVRIDYYPPRGDAKEAWDLIDFSGLFGLSMSLRVNLHGRDSILAAPLVLDLGRWMVALQSAGRAGTVPELGFFFKTPVAGVAPSTFQKQLAALDVLEKACIRGMARRGNVSA